MEIIKLPKNLRILLAIKGFSITDLANELNIPRSSINRIITGETLHPKKSTLKKISNYFHINENQLLGKESIQWNNLIENKQKTRDAVPIISWHDAININNIYDLHNYPTIKIDINTGTSAFALQMQEDLENFFKNTVLIIDPSAKAGHRDYIIVHNQKLSYVELKQLLIDDGKKYFKSLNESQNIVKDSKKYRIIGTIVQTRMDYK